MNDKVLLRTQLFIAPLLTSLEVKQPVIYRRDKSARKETIDKFKEENEKRQRVVLRCYDMEEIRNQNHPKKREKFNGDL